MSQYQRADYENIRLEPGESFAFREFIVPRFTAPWHFHPEIELTLILSGTGQRFVGDGIEDFTAGDLVLLGSKLPHYWHNNPSKTSAQAMVIQFHEQFLGVDFFEKPEWIGVKSLFRKAKRGLQVGGETRKTVAAGIQAMSSLDPPRRLISLLELMLRLAQSTECRPLSSLGFESHLDQKAENRINQCCDFIMKNLQNDISLEKASRVAGMSSSAFCRYFKRVMGKPFSRFVNELRIGKACRALIETDASVSEIAFGCGYNTLSNFNRRFLEVKGCSPEPFEKAVELRIENKLDLMENCMFENWSCCVLYFDCYL